MDYFEIKYHAFSGLNNLEYDILKLLIQDFAEFSRIKRSVHP